MHPVVLLLTALFCCPVAALRARQPLPATELAGIHLEGSSRALPAVGFGTCCRKTSRGQALIDSAKTFLRLGGRHIDTAQKYQNHRDLRRAILESGVPRSELWVTSKVNTITQNLTRAGVLQAVNDSLAELGLDYLDLMLLHRPAATPELRVEQWRGLLDAKAAGLVHSIGVSNFEPQMIRDIINATGQRPSLNQVSFNPRNAARTRPAVRWCLDQGIAVTAYASIKDQVAQEPAATVARAHSASPSQVLLRWALDQGVAVIPGATSEQHIRDNLGTRDFHLTGEEAKLLESR